MWSDEVIRIGLDAWGIIFYPAPMRIGFPAFVMQGGKSGVAVYIKSLFSHLQKVDLENQYELMVPRDEQDLIPLDNPNFGKSAYPSLLANPIVNIAWQNTALPLIARSKGFDLVHIPSYRRIPLIKSVKVVATVHDLATFELDAKYDPARMFYNRKIVPHLIRNADHVITVSHYTKQDIMRIVGYPEEKISVIYSGIDSNLFRPVSRDQARTELRKRHGLEKPFFVYISRLEHPAKNHVRLIEAFERFKKQNDSEHQLVLAGADWNGAKIIRRRVLESPLRKEIHLLGYAPIDSLPLLYNACDLMIYPSLFEGFGFPIVEAMACGANVICSNSSSMREIAGDRLGTFDPRSVDEIVQKMEDALSGPWGEEQRSRVIKYGRGFDWKSTARQVTEIYRKVLS